MYQDFWKFKELMLSYWLVNHPAPSWGLFLEALYKQGYFHAECHKVLKEIQKLYTEGNLCGCIYLMT